MSKIKVRIKASEIVLYSTFVEMEESLYNKYCDSFAKSKTHELIMDDWIDRLGDIADSYDVEITEFEKV